MMIRYRPPPRDEAARLYRKFQRRVGMLPSTGEAPIDYAARIRQAAGVPAGPATEVVDNYLLTRYGPPDPRAMHRLRDSLRSFSTG
jgi:hypothetical protein